MAIQVANSPAAGSIPAGGNAPDRASSVTREPGGEEQDECLDVVGVAYCEGAVRLGEWSFGPMPGDGAGGPAVGMEPPSLSPRS